MTPETKDLLFRRACWFVLQDPEEGHGPSSNVWKSFPVKSQLSDKEFQVALRPPALILFELPDGEKMEPGEDPLRIGFLVHEAFFPDETRLPGVGDLLRFNEIFRYWRLPYDGFLKDCDAELSSFHAEFEGRNCFDGRWIDLLDLPVKDSEDRQDRYLSIKATGGKPDANSPSELFPSWMVYPDDKAFTMPFVVLDDQSDEPFSPYAFEDQSELAPRKFQKVRKRGGVWAKVLNVDRVERKDTDPPETIHRKLIESAPFEHHWASERTYKRWSHYQTLYGFTEHSFAMLCTGTGESHGPVPLSLHFGQMYFDATLLHLYMRVGLFRFSTMLHRITADARDQGTGRQGEFSEWRESFHDLRWRFLQFENLYRFPLFSNQQQHLEMNGMQVKYMDIETL
ncbi:MAG: hypothetical protein KDM64_17480, partial [Verrucomicrobiae bacterium]|nr:hypothetical protein [Verrucomicrobiae bacterium]